MIVGDEEIEARRAVMLAGGSVPLLPPIDGLDGSRARGRTARRRPRTTIPERLVILGGGVVGVELAQAFQTLGSQVTLIEGERGCCRSEEEYAGAQVDGGARASTASTSAPAQKATKVARRRRHDHRHDRRRRRARTATCCSSRSAARRRTETLGLETVGLKPGEPVDVDMRMRVPGHPWLYAIGDINGRALFTHMGKYQARLAVDCLLGHDHVISHGADGPLSPRVIFTDPQVAAVGHTTETAAEAGLEIDVYDTETSGNAGGSFYGRDAPGTTRFLVDRERRIVVGCTITGSRRRRVPARGDDRDRRRGAARAAAPRGARRSPRAARSGSSLIGDSRLIRGTVPRFDVHRTSWYDDHRTYPKEPGMTPASPPPPPKPPFRRVVVFVPLETGS